MASRLVAVTQTSRSTERLSHRLCARAAASWVLPLPPNWASRGTPASPDGARIRVSPGSSLPTMPRPVSGRGLYESASGGTGPQRSGHSTRRPGTQAIRDRVTRLPLDPCSLGTPVAPGFLNDPHLLHEPRCVRQLRGAVAVNSLCRSALWWMAFCPVLGEFY